MLKSEITAAIALALPALRVVDAQAAQVRALKDGFTLKGAALTEAKESVITALRLIMDEFTKEELSRPKFGLVDALKTFGESTPEAQEFGASRSAQSAWSREKRKRLEDPAEAAVDAAVKALVAAVQANPEADEEILLDGIMQAAQEALIKARQAAREAVQV